MGEINTRDNEMQLFIKESRENYLEVIDVEYPQYLFVLDDIDFRVNSGELEVVVNKLSIARSIQKSAENSIPEDMEDEFLEQHSQKIIKELFDPVLHNTLDARRQQP